MSLFRSRRALLVSFALLWSGSTAQAAFERPPPNAIGQGFAGVRLLTQSRLLGRGWSAEFYGGRPFGISELGETSFQVLRGGTWNFGFGAHEFGASDYAEREVFLAFGPTRGTGTLLARVRGLSVSGVGWSARRALTVDVALHVSSPQGWDLAAQSEAILGEVPGGDRSVRTLVGVGLREGRWRVLLEAQQEPESALGIVVGGECAVAPNLALRLGIREEPVAFATGVSVRVLGVEIASSALHGADLATSYQLGMRIGAD